MISSRKLILIILSGILVRLLLMPFFAHQDLFLLTGGQSRLPWLWLFVKDHGSLAHFIEATWLRLVAIATGSEFFLLSIRTYQILNRLTPSVSFSNLYLLAELAFWILVARFFTLLLSGGYFCFQSYYFVFALYVRPI